MLNSIIFAAIAMSQGPQLVCPVRGDEVSEGSPRYVYKDVVYSTCCAGCVGTFKSDPEKVIASKHPGLIGYSLFDPTTGMAVDARKAKSFSDYKNVRYYFADEKNKQAFKNDPKKYAAAPAYSVVGMCIVTGEQVPADKLGAYRDTRAAVNGKEQTMRVYFCCAGCISKFEKEPSKFLSKAKFTKMTLVELK